MSDCTNVEMREALPELLHGRLDANHAARVREHVAACAECAAELELLERVRSAYSAAPAVDTARIVRALPARRPRRASGVGGLRIAAAVVLLLGGAVVTRVVMTGTQYAVDSTLVVLPVDTSPAIALPANDTPRAEPGRSASAARVLAMSLSELDDLDAEDLETLMGALDDIDAVPAAEPDTLIGSVGGVGTE
jgi:anti-sigma factor RsiW